MIYGVVNLRREATLPLVVRNSSLGRGGRRDRCLVPEPVEGFSPILLNLLILILLKFYDI
ncbi:hypothetical protein [Dactylococcopsis salina]|uniref:Uncharacterized protein n=1 Tax=Dactylococcopsis salina (strain PCC 8305) TaxID=13035 RepID=K9YRF5_DACS8|nr:hypothetical protein [Dactylococcopsis salina]AFZ49521.1 hypothetical protein Dacsa_0766 [Dactylococcopsis salina PCC 8305]